MRLFYTRSIELAQKWSETSVVQGYVDLAYVKQTRGDLEGACKALKTAQRLAAKPDAMQPDPVNIAMQEARLELIRGDVEAASRCVAACDLEKRARLDELEREASGESFSLLQTLDAYTTLAWLRTAQGQPDKAMTVLTPLLRATEAAGWAGIIIETLALRALAHQSQDDTPQALAALECALSLAEPEGYVRVFVDKGRPMSQLLRQAASGGIAPEYVSKLLAAFDVSKYEGVEATLPQRRVQPLIEPLTEREMEILRLLPTHLSSTEIAEELVISVNTARFHIKNIYSKLNVHSRAEAVRRAEELGLL